jgi:putative transposase
VQLAHKIELKSNNRAKTYFRKACGISRFVWNWGLSRWQDQYKAGEKPSGFKLKKEFNAIKEAEFPWVFDVTKYAAAQPFLDLQDAWKRYFKKLAEKPKFKKKGKSHDSFYIGGDQIKVEGRKIWIPNLGWVKLREELRFQGKINSVVISRTADRWYAAIQVDADVKFPKHENQVSLGIDLGINHLAVLSNDVGFEAPKPLKELLRNLKRKSRALSKKQKGSGQFQKSKMAIARLHARIANIRRDTLHKITSWIANHNSVVGIEDLNIKGMMANRKLARSISDLGLYEFRRQLEYKLKWREGQVVVHNRFYPSSKTCSQCGIVKEALSLGERIFSCECGLSLSRDLNAALNLTPVPKVIRELTPAETTALWKQAGLVFRTSVNETGNQLQPAC